METYQDELSRFKKWMKQQSFNTLEELMALVIFGDYGYAEAVRRIKAAQQKYALDAALVAPAEQSPVLDIIPAGKSSSQPRQ